MRKIIGRLLPARVRGLLERLRAAFFPDFVTEAYSQEGEDLILKRIFAYKATGFYVDIGAHHPSRLSNTFLFYRRGWRGINVDAMPGSMAAFQQRRPRDINLETAVGQETGATKTFWMFNEPALNTFDEAIANRLVNGPHRNVVTGKREVSVRTVRDILQTHLPAEAAIDFLTIDVEGMDLEVLLSNDWERYRPAYVLAECTGVSFDDLSAHPVSRFLLERGYVFYAKTVNTFFFRERGADPNQYHVPQ